MTRIGLNYFLELLRTPPVVEEAETDTYWLRVCSLVASLRASRHWSLASWTAPLLLLTDTILTEQPSSSDSSCHFNTRLSPRRGGSKMIEWHLPQMGADMVGYGGRVGKVQRHE